MTQHLNCPVCRSERIVIIVSPTSRAFCVDCGSMWGMRWRQIVRWKQQALRQHRRVPPEHPSIAARLNDTK